MNYSKQVIIYMATLMNNSQYTHILSIKNMTRSFKKFEILISMCEMYTAL